MPAIPSTVSGEMARASRVAFWTHPLSTLVDLSDGSKSVLNLRPHVLPKRCHPDRSCTLVVALAVPLRGCCRARLNDPSGRCAGAVSGTK